MSRNQKISKLGHAIRDYRGRYHADSGKWIEAPQPRAMDRIIVWLDRLNLPLQESIAAIDGFKSFPAYRAWLQKL
jgi:hypothetical protein